MPSETDNEHARAGHVVVAATRGRDSAGFEASLSLAKLRATPVVDRTTKEVRAVRPGDIAVLVATNAEASALADALHARKIRAAIARAGLLATPEGVLVDAALRSLLDEGDSLAAAKIDVPLGHGGKSPRAELLPKGQGFTQAAHAWPRTARNRPGQCKG